jgi:hypothetical protein
MPKKTPAFEDKISKAIEAYYQRKKPKIKPLAREFEVPYSTLHARIHGRIKGSTRANNNKTLNLI